MTEKQPQAIADVCQNMCGQHDVQWPIIEDHQQLPGAVRQPTSHHFTG